LLVKTPRSRSTPSSIAVGEDATTLAVVGVSLVPIYQRGQLLNLIINVVQGQLPPTTSSTVVGEDVQAEKVSI
jgi:hypothetical protein